MTRCAGYRPKRLADRPETDETTSRAGRRAIGLPDEPVALLESHCEEQDRERDTAAQLWQDSGYVFTDERGEPLNPNTDHHHGKELLRDAGGRDDRLRDARHMAATVLLILGVPESAVMGLMGWSTTAMAPRYQHITGVVRSDVAQRVGGLIRGRPDAG
ncbi:tyrosine-type recombinase/integrase [Pseudonocardia sp. ICBG162]|uniref:tyrosine-type recombinase/integrase n=1 Tax=Pseudonocardia sp. ICBG162 TaxID=2846761 RepID=UPI001CF6E782|nr:tyrosine-type recombinase/integrase [Pseudonocardia sp. ICBG162]